MLSVSALPVAVLLAAALAAPQAWPAAAEVAEVPGAC